MILIHNRPIRGIKLSKESLEDQLTCTSFDASSVERNNAQCS